MFDLNIVNSKLSPRARRTLNELLPEFRKESKEEIFVKVRKVSIDKLLTNTRENKW